MSTLNLRWRQSPRCRVAEAWAALKNCAQQLVWLARPKFALRCFRFLTRRRKSPKISPCNSRQAPKRFGPAIRTEPWRSTFLRPRRSGQRRKSARNFHQSFASPVNEGTPQHGLSPKQLRGFMPISSFILPLASHSHRSLHVRSL
jgi:hypothetical protein